MKYILSAIIIMATGITYAQSKTETYPANRQELYNTIIALDKAVFDAYNKCDIAAFESYFTADTEFYHDKGGVTLTSTKLAESVKNNLCGTPGRKVIREAITGTLEVYPMDNYGAILTGDHLFYEEVNGTRKLTGKAKFTHLWQFKDGKWKMSRVLSYDHQTAK